MTIKPILLDNTALSNFALVERPDLILNLWGEACATTAAVLAEYRAGILSRGLPAQIWDNLPLLTLRPEEAALADEMAARLGRGERTCLAIAVQRHGLFVCDDARARREAQRQGVPVSGTIGILVLNVRNGSLTPAEGNEILSRMIFLGYRSPVTTLNAWL